MSDPRLTPARPDFAAEELRGQVSAPLYARGRVKIIARGIANLRAAPKSGAGLLTQLLFGERFTVYDERDGWAWGQAALDSYVGYTRIANLADPGPAPTHRVTALSTPLLPLPDVKSAARDFLPMNAKLSVTNMEGRFARVDGRGFVFAGHLAPIASAQSDWVSVAQRFLGAPYLWGGKTAAGLDCSGLVQTALEAGGIRAPRDTDMMEAALGAAVSAESAELQRGDIVFWKGHMGVMLGSTRLLHANAFHMEVAIESLAVAVPRITLEVGPIRVVKRLR